MHKRRLIIIWGMASGLWLTSQSYQRVYAPPIPPDPTDVGACCYGPAGADLSTTRGDCADPLQSPSGKRGIFVEGTFNDTDDVSPCDLLPGGD